MISSEAGTTAEALRASPRLFDNPLLDKLSRVHWSIPLFIYTPVVALLAWLSFRSFSPFAVVLATAAGYAIWTLIEYFGHRYLFHAEFPGEWGARLHFLIHGVHHDHPNDPLRLVMPPLLSGPIMLIALLVALVDLRAPARLSNAHGLYHRIPRLRYGALLRASCDTDDTCRTLSTPGAYAASFP